MILFTWAFIITLGVFGYGACKKWINQEKSWEGKAIVAGYWILWILAVAGLISTSELIKEHIKPFSTLLAGITIATTIMSIKRK